jgi:hypothetical protein
MFPISMETAGPLEEFRGRTNELIGDEKFDEPSIWFPEAEAVDKLHETCYPICQVLTLEEEVSNCCLKIIRCRNAYCTVTKCPITHKGRGTAIAATASNVFVNKKPAGATFVEPRVDGHLLHQSVVDEWKCKILPL